MTKEFHCHNCGYTFSLDWRHKRKPYCPNCGEHYDVLRVSCDNRPRKTEFKRGRWTVEDKELLKLLCKSRLTYEEIGQRLGRSKNAIGQKLKELMKGEAQTR